MSTNKTFVEYAERSDQTLASSDVLRQSVAPALLEGLTQTQLEILEKVARIHSEPIEPLEVRQRSPDKVAASKAIHKRINPGFVDMPYQSTNSAEYKYIPAPDFSTCYLKTKSDCDFQGFAAQAILKHVDLNKTSH